MGEYIGRDSVGAPILFKIKGDKPDQAEMGRINDILTKGPPQTAVPEPEAASEASGVLTVAGRGIARGWNEIQAGVDTGMQSFYETLGDKESAKEWEEAAQEQRAERDTYASPEGSFLDSNTNKAHAIAGTVGQSAPSMAAGLAGMVAGGAAGSVAGPIGTVVGGVIGGALGYAPQMLNANAERQIEQFGRVKDWKKAYASTALGAGVETITDKIGLKVVGALWDGAKIVGKAIPKSTEKIVREASKNAVDKAATVVFKKMGTGIGLGALTGAAEETIQQGLERWQAELPLMDDAAKKEYLESAIMGGIVESIFGGGAGAYGAHKQIKNQKALSDAQEEIDSELAKLSSAAKTYGPQYEEKRNAPYKEAPSIAEPKRTEPIEGQLMLPDFSAPTREQTMLNKTENQLPPGLRDSEVGEGPLEAAGEQPTSLLTEARQKGPVSEEAAASAVGRGRGAPAPGYGVYDAVDEFDKNAAPLPSNILAARRKVEAALTAFNNAKDGTEKQYAQGGLFASLQDLADISPYQAQAKINGLIGQRFPHLRKLIKIPTKPTSNVPPVSPATPISPAPTTPSTPTPRIGEHGPTPPPFSDEEYRHAIDTLRDEGVLSHDKIAKVLGVSKPQAEAYFAEMLKRNDAHPAGTSNQYAQITVPKGMSSRKQSNVRGKMSPYRARDYIVKPVRPANGSLPYSVHVNGKRMGQKGGNAFATSQEAQAFIDTKVPAKKKKDATIVEDNTGIQYGIHELHYEHLPNREQRLIGEQVVNTYMTEAEAQEAIKGYDPAYSPETNKQRTQKKAPEEIAAAINRDFEQATGSIGEQLRERGQKVLGPGRLELGIAPRIVHPDHPDAIVEGTSDHIFKENPEGVRKIVGNIIRLSHDLYNPNLTPEQRAKLMEQVLNHELVHALRSLDLLTSEEWDTLFQHAASAKVPGKTFTWLQRAMVRTGALRPKPGEKPINPQSLAEEAIAEMVRHYINDPTAFRNPHRGLLRKLADFIKKLMRLGEKHDAADLIDTIFEGGIADRKIGHGGLGPRNAEDTQFSLLKTDNFYLETERFLQKVTTEEAPKNHWIKMLSSAGIKPEELNWLGIKQWLQDIPVDKDPDGKGGMIHRNDILNFVKASGPNVMPVIFAKQAHPDLAQAAVMDPRWEEKSQVTSDKTYAEVAFTFPGREGEPVYYDSQGHMLVPDNSDSGDGRRKLGNVLAFARFRDIVENGKRILFIEEMQSDLHQRGSMQGYYSKSAMVKVNAMRDEARAAYDEMRRLKSEQIRVADEIWKLGQMEKQHLAGTQGLENVPEIQETLTGIREARTAKMRELATIPAQQDAATDKHTELVRAVNAATKRLDIPNAPFKSNWEDYVIRRMIRHATEHGYDGIAWHGSPESVAETEGYGDLEVTQDEKGRDQYKAYGMTPVSPIINRYMLKLPRITRGIAEPFGVNLDHNKVDRSHVPSKWIPEERGQHDDDFLLEAAMGEDPLARRNDRIRAAFPGGRDLVTTLNQLNEHHTYGASHGWYRSEADEKLAADLLTKLKRARQIAINRREGQRGFDAPTIFFDAGIQPDEMDHILSWSENADFYAGPMAEKGKAGFQHDNYQLMFNQDMMRSFEEGSQPFFSMVRERKQEIMADPKFQQWFGEGVVTEEDDTPKVVYHYSKSDQQFGRFNRLSHFGTAKAAEDRQVGSADKGLENRFPFMKQADRRQMFFENFSPPRGQHVYPVFLNLRRPLHIKDSTTNHNAFQYATAMADAGILSEREFTEITRGSAEPVSASWDAPIAKPDEEAMLTQLIEKLEKAGYDGFSYENTIEDKGSLSYVALHPTQIKSIFNQGTWSETNPDIMYSKLEARGADLLENDDKFKHWFGGSRVAKENGDPLLMFTGTSKDTDFNVFKSARNGIWFTDDPNEASQYAVENDSMGYAPDPSEPWKMKAKNTASRVIPAFLSIKNPYLFNGDELTAWVRDPRNSNYKRAQGILFDRLKTSGHDGVKWGDNIWIAFQGGQVKSALAEEFSKESDSFKYSMVRPQYSATAPLGERVPVTAPLDRLAEVHNKLTYDNLSQPIHRVIEWAVPGAARKIRYKGKVDDSIISLQDRMLSVGRLIDRMKKNGGFITNENDTYLRQQLYSSQVDAHLQANDRDYYKKLTDTIAGLHVTQRDVDEAKTIDEKVATILKQYSNPKHALSELYLYAQHAQERNAVMRRRNERLAARGERVLQHAAGSGMGDGTAQAVLMWFDSKSFGNEFSDLTNENSVRSRMRALVANTNDVRVRAGLTPDFRTMIHPDGTPVDPYEDYVPIRGRIDEEATINFDEDMDDFFAKTGKGFNIRGKEDFSALGRETMGRDIVAHAIMQNQETIVRGGKNKVVQSFRQLILDNPEQMSEVATILDEPRTRYTFENGVVKQKKDIRYLNDPKVLKGKIDGQQFYIEMKDQRVIAAMGEKSGLGRDSGMNALMKGLLKVNRILAATRTSYSPEFMVANVVRDLEAAMINLSESGKKGLRRKVMASVVPALRGVRQSLRSGTPTGEWAAVHEEFRRHGGHTAVLGIRELEDTINNMNGILSEDVSGNISKVKKPIRAIFKFVSDYNLVAENGTRLAAYKVLRDQYLELSGDPHNPQNQLRAREMAAFAAKNLTVNFNMGGEMKSNMSALYMFFNASMQGSLALLNPFIRSPRMRKVWLGVLTAGAVQDMVMSMLSPEDEDGEKTYDKIPEHILEHNMIFMDPFGMTERGYFSLPMPYLMNGIWNFGRAASRAARGKYTYGQLMKTGGMTLVDSLNPMGGSNSWLNWVAPSVVDPFVDLIMNEDFTGKPIAPPVSPYDNVTENRSQRYWNNTHPLYVTVADWMSQLTGRQGDFIPGAVEASPNQVEYAVDWVTGGTGTFLARAYSLATGAATGDLSEIEARDIPFFRKVYGSITTRNDLEDYIEGRDQVLRIRKALQDARKDGDTEGYMQIKRMYPKEASIAGRINAIENARKKKSTQIKKIRENTRIAEAEKERRIKLLKERQDVLVGQGNKELAAID